MAASKSIVTPTQRIQHERFTTKQHGYQLWDLSLSLTGNIAVCGFNSSGRTFIDLYFGRNSDSRDKFKLFYSKEFEKYSDYNYRCISFLQNDRQIVSCIGDKIEIIDTKNESKVLRSRRVNGEISCVAVREGEIFIGLVRSQTLIVFNNDLKETKKIILKGIQDGDWPEDLQVIKDTVFVRTAGPDGKVYTINERDGRVISEFTDSLYDTARSLAVSESLGLVAVVWEWRRIIVYSLNENKSLLVFDDDSIDVDRIRISDRDRMMITGNIETGEIEMYYLDQLFSFEAMKRTLAYIVTSDECEKVRKHFGVTEEEVRRKELDDENEDKVADDNTAFLFSWEKEEREEKKKIKKMECLLSIIEEKGHLDPHNINNLRDAVTAIGDEMRVSNLQGPMDGYVLHGMTLKDPLTRRITSQKTLEDERNELSALLKIANSKVQEYEETLDVKESEILKMKRQFEEQEQILKSQLEQTKQLLDLSRTESAEKIETLTRELDQTKIESAETSKRLTEELTESVKETEALAKELNNTNQTLDLSRTESIEQMEVLTSELEETRKNLKESAKRIETLTNELEQTKTVSTKRIEKLTEDLKETRESLDAREAELEQSRRNSTKTIETLTEKLTQTKQSLDLTRTESVKQLDTLTLQLEDTEQKLNSNIKENETLHRDLEITRQVLEQTIQDRNDTRTELERYQLEFAKESKALKEVLKQTKEFMAELQKQTVEDRHVDDSEETLDEDVSKLAAEFGRLTVAVAEHLTLDNCLKLAMLFNVPASDCDIVRRLSLIESPGVKFLDVLKKRKVINIFDVNNLQKGLAFIHLEAVNHDLVAPYQERVSDDQYEENKLEEMFTWEDDDAFVNIVKDDAVRQTRDSQTQPEEDTRPDKTSHGEPKAPHSDTDVENRDLRLKDKLHQLYTEFSIGREGGTIQVANVSLTVPPDAVHKSHVIALTVMNESPLPLDREVDTARMTPLIKLEPLGLMFKKSLQLNIPHSALIPEPENHDVIIYSGQSLKSKENVSDYIQWTVERSVPRQLKEKSVTIDIQCLSYLSASLVTQTKTPPLHIVRAVPFVDGVRNPDDDITLTICFCSDSDAEYNMLLSDYKTKLPLEQYSTLQLHRHSESDEDDAGFLSVNVTSVNNAYVPDAEQAVKKFAISLLCTASRVSHQLRLKKNQRTDRDVVDMELTFSQTQYEPTKITLKARVKDLIVSEESEALLTGHISQGNKKTYKDMVVNISSNLNTEGCRKLATHFQLSPEETEMIASIEDAGKMLLKTLENRLVIDSEKMIHFFEALKACNLDETAELVSEYISEVSKQTQEEQKLEEDKKNEENEEGSPALPHLKKKGQRKTCSSVSDQLVQTTLSSSCISSEVHVKTLTKEGYTEHEVVEALDISRNRLFMARKVLKVLGEPLDVQRSKDIFLHKEQYIDENGGEISLIESNVHMVIPGGAVSSGCIISLTMMTSKQGNVPTEVRTSQLTPVVKCGQEGLALNNPVSIRIPHCATETDGIISTDMYLGFSSEGEEGILWRKRKQHEPAPVLKKDHFEVFLTQLCAISLNIAVDYKKPLAKRLRVLPLIQRVENPSDDLVVTLWIYNDDETEHMHLLHEEINVAGKIKLHDFKHCTMKGPGNDKEVHMKFESNKISPSADMKKILSSTAWHNTRHSIEFRFQNKEGINDVSFKLRICRKQILRTIDELHFDLKITLAELMQKNRESTRLSIQRQPQSAMVNAFEGLVNKLSGDFNMDTCLEIARIFGLSADFIARMKESRDPGKVLFDELIHEQLVTAANVSALDSALTKSGKEHLSELVKEYRMRNATFPTTILTLL